MKKLLIVFGLAMLSLVDAMAETPRVDVFILNSSFTAFMQNAFGIKAPLPSIQVWVYHPSADVDGYRVQGSYWDALGSRHDVLQDVVNQGSGTDSPLLAVFFVDARTVSIMVTPYKLSGTAIFQVNQ